jgi:hypothetical protein
MEITKKARFNTAFYGGKAYLQGDVIVQRWLESQQDRLLHPRFRELKDAMSNETKLEGILSVFNVADDGSPIIGNWMLLRCSMAAQKLAGTWNKYKVSADAWKGSISFEPSFCHLSNGKPITSPDSVEVYTVTVKDGAKSRSFFRAYQIIKAGSEFEFTLNFPDDLCQKIEGKGKDKIFSPDPDSTIECVKAILDKMQIVGLGAYRERFGKFNYIE